MIIFPAIDLKEGHCVRLEKGKIDRATIFNVNPVSQANFFEQAGFEWLHLIDLDKAVGRGDNQEVLVDILAHSGLKSQIGGGIRDRGQIEFWLERGASRVILGTSACADPIFAKSACLDFEDQIVVALDGADGKVAIKGWQEVSAETVLDATKRISDWGAAAILFTDIDRDGMGVGINIESVLRLSEQSTVPIIASGGLSSLQDIKDLSAHNSKNKNIEGVIAGRALYDGRLDGKAALDWVRRAC